MRCVFCEAGETHPQRVTTEQNEAGELVALIRNFPAGVCDICGEACYQAEDWAKVEPLLADGKLPTRMTCVTAYRLSALCPCHAAQTGDERS
jgi:YgiT-type zinc finger domain-containing protein